MSSVPAYVTRPCFRKKKKPEQQKSTQTNKQEPCCAQGGTTAQPSGEQLCQPPQIKICKFPAAPHLGKEEPGSSGCPWSWAG